MDVKQEGLGSCPICGTPVMQALGQGVTNGVCFGCLEKDAIKTGRNVVVTESDESIDSKVTITEVTGMEQPVVKQKAIVATNVVTVKVTLDDLSKGDALVILLSRLNDALDNMPFSTMKDAKLVMAIQAGIEKKLAHIKGDK